MTLTEYLAREKISQEAFGKRLGLSQGRISQLSRQGTESLPVAMAICEATDGCVSVEEMWSGTWSKYLNNGGRR